MQKDKENANSSKHDTKDGDTGDWHVNLRNAYAGVSGAQAADYLESTQIGKFSTKGGTGFAAEDANALNDQLRGHKVDRVGINNAKDGADRIVDGQPIQTKYFDSASQTVRDAFGADGNYRYGKMQLEVPSDQYEDALKLMRKRIEDGKVLGVQNPDEAIELVKKGSVTYKQARNIARAGNIDSLKYDAKNSAVTSGYAFAIGFAFNYATAIWNGEDPKDALKSAVASGIQASGTAFITSVVSSQLLRTQTARAATIIAREGVKSAAKTKVGKVLIEKVASASLGKSVHGAAAVNHVSKLLRSNVITGAVTVGVLTLPDLYRASISKNISWAQVGKNLVVNISGVAAGTAGWAGGMAAGAALGSVLPVLGTVAGGVVGGILGAMGAGLGGSAASKYAMDYLVDDDAKEMGEIAKNELPLVAFDYLLTEDEFNKYTTQAFEALSQDFLKDMYAAKDRRRFIADKFDKIAQAIVKARQVIVMPSDEKVREFIAQMVADAADLKDVSDENSILDSDPNTPNFVFYGQQKILEKLVPVTVKESKGGLLGKKLLIETFLGNRHE